jgi:integrase
MVARAPQFIVPLHASRNGSNYAERARSWDEQRLLFAELPDRLVRMALFAVNTGCRDGEICGLR